MHPQICDFFVISLFKFSLLNSNDFGLQFILTDLRQKNSNLTCKKWRSNCIFDNATCAEANCLKNYDGRKNFKNYWTTPFTCQFDELDGKISLDFMWLMTGCLPSNTAQSICFFSDRSSRIKSVMSDRLINRISMRRHDTKRRQTTGTRTVIRRVNLLMMHIRCLPFRPSIIHFTYWSPFDGGGT